MRPRGGRRKEMARTTESERRAARGIEPCVERAEPSQEGILGEVGGVHHHPKVGPEGALKEKVHEAVPPVGMVGQEEYRPLRKGAAEVVESPCVHRKKGALHPTKNPRSGNAAGKPVMFHWRPRNSRASWR